MQGLSQVFLRQKLTWYDKCYSKESAKFFLVVAKCGLKIALFNNCANNSESFGMVFANSKFVPNF